MMHLAMPAGADDDFIHKQCKRSGWVGFRARWLEAAKTYREAGGDPWRICPANFDETEQAQLFKLYDNRRGTQPIARIREPIEAHRACPMCGSGGGRSLDHALPRSRFPEFSILRENLVPACTICNSEEKGAIYRGDAPPERLIHPYYDTWASQPLWQAKFGPDLNAIVISAVSLSTLPVAQRVTVDFHLKTLLGRTWRQSSISYWAVLPQMIRNRIGTAVSVANAKLLLDDWLQYEECCTGVNAWRTAFLRGALADDRVPGHLAHTANNRSHEIAP